MRMNRVMRFALALGLLAGFAAADPIPVDLSSLGGGTAFNKPPGLFLGDPSSSPTESAPAPDNTKDIPVLFLAPEEQAKVDLAVILAGVKTPFARITFNYNVVKPTPDPRFPPAPVPDFVKLAFEGPTAPPVTVATSTSIGPLPTSPDSFSSESGWMNFSSGTIPLDPFLIQAPKGFGLLIYDLRVEPVPEPGTIALCGVAMVGFAVRRRRRRRLAARRQ